MFERCPKCSKFYLTRNYDNDDYNKYNEFCLNCNYESGLLYDNEEVVVEAK